MTTTIQPAPRRASTAGQASALVLAGLLLLVGPGSTAAQEGTVREAAPVLEALDAYTGHWRSEQKTSRQGGTFHFEYDLDWMDEGGTVADMLITQVMADGSTSVVFDGVKGREPDGSGVYYWAVSPSGRGSRGEVFLEDDRLITLYDGWTADGSVVQIRDVFMPVEGDAFDSRTYLRPMPDAEWRQIGADQWRRAGTSAAPGSGQASAGDGSGDGARRVVRESYVGPDGEDSGPGTPVALSEVWERQGGRWLLLRVTAFPLDDG